MELFNEVFRRVTVVGTAIGKGARVLANLRGLSTGAGDDGEKDEGSLLYGVIGLIVRPRPKNAAGAAHGIAAVAPDQLVPLAMFDPRIAQARGELSTGTISLAGYEGQHVTLEAARTHPYGKITIEVPQIVGGGARLIIDGGALGPTIKLERDGPPPSSITLGPGGNVAIVGIALTFNGVPMQVP